MRIDMADFQGDKKYTYYNFSMVGNAANKSLYVHTLGDRRYGIWNATHIYKTPLTQRETIQNTITTLEET